MFLLVNLNLNLIILLRVLSPSRKELHFASQFVYVVSCVVDHVLLTFNFASRTCSLLPIHIFCRHSHRDCLISILQLIIASWRSSILNFVNSLFATLYRIRLNLVNLLLIRIWTGLPRFENRKVLFWGSLLHGLLHFVTHFSSLNLCGLFLGETFQEYSVTRRLGKFWIHLNSIA